MKIFSLLSVFLLLLNFSAAAQETETPPAAAVETPAPVIGPAIAEEIVQPVHALALHGAPKYGPDFKHLDYANPDAPQGGMLKLGAVGSFDSLNPFIVKGEPADGLNFLRSGFVYESLMQNSWDEPFTLYGV
ncbi:MAG TPA: hypothetical protein DEA55_09500, partial [Rhodospirillaceae bacterium]|nr:hypothetical protein [Rhodospirillaceae bacterium]